MVLPLKNSRKYLLLPLLCFALNGCKVGPDYHAPDFKPPEQFAASPTPSGMGPFPDKKNKAPVVDAAQWWKSLGDDTLNGLIDKAVKANPELDIALTRLQEAREQEAVVLGERLPDINASGGAAKGTGNNLVRGRADQPLVSGDNTTGYQHITQIYGFDAGWELDLFGKYRREAEAARYDRQAARSARDDVLISIIADVVRAYVDMRGLQMQQAVLKQNIDAATKYVNFVQQRYDRGITNGLDLTLAQRQMDTLQAEAAPLKAETDAAQYTIAVLCGEFPENLMKDLDKPGQIPQTPEKIETGLPLDLLRRRPDIHEAERQLASATAKVGVATANLFPHFVLTGGAGYQGQGLGVTPVQQSFIWAIGPSVSWPLLDFGALDALVNIADLNTHAQLMNYKQTVLNAVKEVDTAATAYDAQQDRLKNLRKALDASREALSLASQRYDRGLTDSLNVIDAQRQQFELERQYVIAQQNAAEQFIILYKALGGGWEQYQSIPSIRAPQPAIIAALRRSVESDDAAQNMAPLK
jgi:NodT family efflux transporter outer membrane factor (OMF) lipoprotein